MVQLSQSLLLQQKQSPQQVLLSTLLQLPVLRLEQRIKQELELNPLLELDMEIEQEMELKEEKDDDQEEEEEEEEEIDWEEILNDEDNFETKMPREVRERETERPEPAPITFMDNLFQQLQLAPLSEEQMKIGEHILWCIDDDGYLACKVEHIVEDLDVEPEAVEEVLAIIQNFDPVGIGARNLQECLLVQLNEQDPKDELAILMIRDCFEDFSNKRFEKVARKLEISLDELKQIMEVVSKLNPKPGEKYVSEAENYIIPDVLVEPVEGKLTITLNDWNIPRLRINDSYRRLLKEKKKVSKETRDYIRHRLESARWIINSIYQRRSTIQRVMEALLNHQGEFFEKGKEYLKPLILKDVANDVNLDISTVSRVTSGKYVQTDFGVFELKYFFSERLETANGEEVSNKLIKAKIKKIIEKENSNKPYNDQILSDMLRKDGFIVARRTVAKYREQMMIPVGRLRRKI